MSSSPLPGPPSNAPATLQQPSASTTSTTKRSSIPAKPHHPVDAKLERLKKDTLPTSPYLLRLKARSAQYHARDRYYWRKDTYFDEDEAELQYLTFRQIHEDPILQAHGQWDDGNGGIAPKEPPSSQTSSSRTPVAGQIAKKKISLADYQKLDKSKLKNSDVNATAVKGPIETNPQDVKEAPKKEGPKREGEGEGGADLNIKAAETREKVLEIARKRYALYLSHFII